jgi:adenylate cyclase
MSGTGLTIQPHRLAPLSAILIFSAASCAFFNVLVVPGGRPLLGAMFGVIASAGILAFIQATRSVGLQHRLRRLPFPLYVPASLGVYGLLTMMSTGIAGAILWTTGGMRRSLLEVVVAPREGFIYPFLMLAVVVIALRIKDLIGAEVLLSLLTGRYYTPLTEQRVFLFIDVAGSTQFAERFGDLPAQEYLGRFFATLAEPVRRYRGSIYDYVGDLAIVSWPLQRGVENARCLRCIFALKEEIERERQFWQSRFGTVPRFRAAIHGGSVVAAEIGVDRHKIAYFGDTVNTTARLEQLCRELDAPILISAELLSRIEVLPRGVCASNLGSHSVRGRDHPIRVAALAVTAPSAECRQAPGP